MAGIAVATILACVVFFWAWRSGLASGAVQPTRFAGYVDVTVAPPYPFEQAATSATSDVVLAFLVAFPCGLSQDVCKASWGATYGLEEASGARNSELAGVTIMTMNCGASRSSSQGTLDATWVKGRPADD